MKLLPMFAVPFLHTVIPDCAALNAELHALFVQRERDGERWRNPIPSMAIAPGLFESRFDLFAWPDACVQALHDVCMGHLLRTVAELNGYSLEQMRQLEVQSHAWFHVTRRGGRFDLHNHPMASWSGVYCVSPGRHDAGARDSGVLHFQNPHHAANMYKDPGNSQMREDFALKGRGLSFVAGELVLFPSWVLHEVLPFEGEGERVTVAFNSWFRPRPGAGFLPERIASPSPSLR